MTLTETKAERQAWLRDAGGARTDESTQSRPQWIIDGSVSALQAEAGQRAAMTLTCPKVESEWTWQNTTTFGVFIICAAWAFSSLMRAMKS